MSSSDLASLVARLEKVAAVLESQAGSRGGSSGSSQAAAPTGQKPSALPAVDSGSSSSSGSKSLDGFDEILNGSFKSFLEQGRALGGDLTEQLDMVERAFTAQRNFLEMASKSKKPAQSDLPALLKDTSEAIAEITAFSENHRRSNQFNHLSAVASGIPALGWVTVEPKPAPFVKEMKDSAMFYTNRVLKDTKDSDPKQAEWGKTWIQVLEDLAAYIKDVHTTGLVWNAQGGEAKRPASPTKPSASKAATPAADAGAGANVRAGLFAELSKEGGVTAGLKKVDKSQMTHKNPALRASSVVPATSAPAASDSKPAAPTKAAAAPPVFELQGKKWVIENQRDNQTIVIEDANIKQTAYIYKCERSTIQIKGKINSITMDSCKKTAVVFENCVAAFEMVNCQSCQAQVTGAVPTVSIEKTDGAQIYLSNDSVKAQIISAKSSEMNILVPVGPDGEFKEFAVPEQYKTHFNGEKLVTEINEIAG